MEHVVPTLSDLLDCDAQSADEFRGALVQFDPDALRIADSAVSILDRTGQAFGATGLLNQEEGRFSSLCGSARLNPRDAFAFFKEARFLEAGGLAVDPVSDAKDALGEIMALYVRSCLVLRLQRDYMFGFTDLLRNRLVSATGYLRLQSETTALLKLILTDSSVATEWFRATEPAAGRRFHRNHIAQLKEIMSDYRIRFYYDRASSSALHSAVGGIMHGVLHGRSVEDEKDKQRAVRLVFQDIEDPEELFLWYCDYMRAHERVISAIPDFIPELDDPSLTKEAIPEFASKVDGLWRRLQPVLSSLRSKGSEESLLLVLPAVR